MVSAARVCGMTDRPLPDAAMTAHGGSYGPN